MSDAVTTRTLINTDRYLDIRFTNISDGTGESAVKKVDHTSYTTFGGLGVQYFSIVECVAVIQGFTSVRILFDATTDDVGLVLAPGINVYDFSQSGGFFDPKSSGFTGDILFTTAGAASGATYDIRLLLKKSRSTW